MARREWQFYSAPEFLVFVNCVRIVIKDTEVLIAHLFADNYPHAFHRNRFLLAIHRYPKYQLHKVSRPKRLPILQFGEPEGLRGFTMKLFSVLQAPSIYLEIRFSHSGSLTDVLP